MSFACHRGVMLIKSNNNESMVCPCSGAYMRGENGFLGTVPTFEPCPGCPWKKLNVPDSRGLNFKIKLTKIVIKLAKIHISKAIFFRFSWGSCLFE